MDNFSVIEPGEARAEAGELPIVDVSRRHLPTLTDAAWDALVLANDPIRFFLRSGVLTRLDQDEAGNHFFQALNLDRLTSIMARIAQWEKILADGSAVSVFPLPQVIRDMLAVPDSRLPWVDALSETPVLTPQGRILSHPGYDQESRIFLRSKFQIRPVPERPSKEEIGQAVDWINEPLTDFPFESSADKAHAVALFLLGFVRPYIKGPTPLHLLDAPTPGSGKSLLAEVLLSPSHGTNKGIVAAANDDDEWRKRLSAQFREGRPVVNVDNVRRPLDSGTLAAALTATTWEDRLLGSTEMIRVPVRCVWVATGNNVVISTELARRTVRIRLDPKVETPEDREGFRHPRLLEWVAEHRTDLVWAALTLIQAWLVEGKPKLKTAAPLGSFEEWSNIIGGILEVAGINGFLKNRRELYLESDFEGQAWRAFVAEWWDQYGSRSVKTPELFVVADTIDGLPLGNGNEQSRKTSLGKRLASMRGRIIGGFRITRAGSGHGGSILWNLISSPGSETTPPTPPSHTEQELEPFSSGGGTGGVSRTPTIPTRTPPSESVDNQGPGGHGGVGGVKNHLAGENDFLTGDPGRS